MKGRGFISIGYTKTASSLGYATSASRGFWNALSKKWQRLKPSVQPSRKKQGQSPVKSRVYKKVSPPPQRPPPRRINLQPQTLQLGIRSCGTTFRIFLCSG